MKLGSRDFTDLNLAAMQPSLPGLQSAFVGSQSDSERIGVGLHAQSVKESTTETL